MEYISLLSLQADDHVFITVYPKSTSFETDNGKITSWNILTCSVSTGPEGITCSEDFKEPFPPRCDEPKDCLWCTCHDDLSFVDQPLDELEDTLYIDLEWIYATGYSKGGMFVHRLVCDEVDCFAASTPLA